MVHPQTFWNPSSGGKTTNFSFLPRPLQGFASKLLAAQTARPQAGMSPYPVIAPNNQTYNQQPQQQSYGATGVAGNGEFKTNLIS